MKRFTYSLLGLLVASLSANAQVLLSGGLTYSQNFDLLPFTPTSATWTDNGTVLTDSSLLVGWYAARTNGGTGTGLSYSVMRVDAGGNNSGSLYSYGAAGSSDRALGSLSSGTPNVNALGLRIKNDTGSTFTGDIAISYTGEQWRNGGNVTAQNILTFGYSISSTPFTSPLSINAVDPAYTALPSLNFLSPTTGATAAALDGNLLANQAALSGTITGVTLNAGDEIMLRWYDINDAGNDHGGGIDNLAVTFTAASVPEPQILGLLGGFSVLAFWMRRRK